MAIASRIAAPSPLPTAFVEAFDGLLAGAVSLDFARRALVSAIEHDLDGGDTIEALIEEAYESTRLSDEDYEALRKELLRLRSEDIPTDWSEVAAAHAPATRPVAAAHPEPQTASGKTRSLIPGATLRGRFVLQAKTATGSMGDIYKAVDRRQQELGSADPFVAIKVVSPGFTNYAEGVRILQYEATLGQKLTHPHIARVLDFDRDGENAFVTLEWLEGESLGELLTRLRSLPLATARARQVLEEIGAALSHAHRVGVVHGDVKPGNIFLTAAGTAKLLDFGAARSTDAASDTLTGRTPAYASCEVLAGVAATPQDDVYSLACVAYRMLAGQRAFGRMSAAEAERAGAQPARIAHLSDGQWRALNRALSFRRAARPAGVEDFLSAFSAVAQAAHPSPTVHAPLHITVGIAPRRRLVASAAALVACGVVLAMLLKPPADAPLQAAAPPAALPDTAISEQPAAADPNESATGGSGEITRAVPTIIRKGAEPRRAPPTETNEGSSFPSKQSTFVNTQPAAPANDLPQTAPQPQPVPDVSAVPVTNVRPDDPMANLARPDAAPVASGQTAMLPPAAATPPGNTASAEAGPAAIDFAKLRIRKYVEPRNRPDRAKVPGWVSVAFHVDRDGSTSHVSVVDAEPKGRYDADVLAAVGTWRFEPVIEAGKPVERQTTVRIRFEWK